MCCQLGNDQEWWGFHGSLVGFRAQGCMRWQVGEMMQPGAIPCRSHPTNSRNQGSLGLRAQVEMFGANLFLSREQRQSPMY